MNVIETIQQAFTSYLETAFSVDPQTLTSSDLFSLNIDENKQQFGDLSSNAAMILAKPLGRNPRELAQTIANGFTHSYISDVQVAGPGFLNFTLTRTALHDLCTDLFIAKETFFKLNPSEKKHTFNLEFVSANPTGPMHLGNGRGGIIGDVLANVLKFIGHKATKEYYINDAGAQIKKLGASFKVRYLQAIGQDVALPEEGYHGSYLVDLARELITEQGGGLADQPDEFFAEYAKDKILVMIQQTLKDYGIEFDVWFSERHLHMSGAIESALELLKQKGYLYEHEDALWFKSTEFGDDKDRVVRKSSGELTYAAADIAYLMDKVERGADRLILILGHDHHSYAVRLKTILQALDLPSHPHLDVILYQLVKMKVQGEQMRMSKRAANIVTLRDVIDTVGKDVARFFYLHRKADAQLEFDLDLAMKQTDENPVYYIQYAYVRTNSILQKAQEVPDFKDVTQDDISHIGQNEALLIKKIVSLKDLLKNLSLNLHSHLLANYVIELATIFHKYYTHNRVIDLENIPQSRSRLLMITLVRDTLGTSFDLLGISKPEKM
jgi:arginyl-tRNA synthetase